MKLLLSALLAVSFAFSMQDPKNMSRQMLEDKFIQAQTVIAQQRETIEFQRSAFNLVWNVNYGNDFERANAQADLKRIVMISFVNKS